MDRLARAVQGLSIFAIALIAFITLALAIMAFMNHFILPESLTDWLSVIVDIFVGTSLAIFAGLTYHTHQIEYKNKNNKEISQIYIKLKQLTDRHSHLKADTTEEIDDSFLLESISLCNEAELLMPRELGSYMSKIRGIISNLKDSQDNLYSLKLNNDTSEVICNPDWKSINKKYKNEIFPNFLSEFVHGNHLEEFKKHLK